MGQIKSILKIRTDWSHLHFDFRRDRSLHKLKFFFTWNLWERFNSDIPTKKIRIKDFHELVIYRFEFPAFYLPNGWQFAPIQRSELGFLKTFSGK